MKNIYAVIGAGGCGRSIMPVVKNNNGKNNQYFFIDDYIEKSNINGTELIKLNKLLDFKESNLNVFIAIADTNLRYTYYQKVKNHNLIFENLIAKNSLLMDEIKIGKGCLISPFVTLASNIKIGNFFHANLYSYVEHDCQIGNFVTFAPGVKCNGNVIIEDFAYIGSGAIIKNGLFNKKIKIGKGSVVGAGSVVIDDVEPYSTVAGVPAKKIK
mgnify:CR=1 FL=1